ncbi:MAG: phosphorylase [Azoarcus sp.]|nr:MAG: phosphorylase [Azoarcus sp.]TVT52851.1 MAG: phosphorylase [Azoarcus sp. PHD]
MTSSPSTPASSLLELSDRCTLNALAAGTLQPISTEKIVLNDGGFDFSVRWVSSLERKNAARVEAVTRRTPDFNPFLPPEPTLTVAPLGPDHLAVLNKYPVIERHLLIITRHFEAQTAPLKVADFSALAQVMQAHGGLGFYNGGTVAGSSQPHKHLQWVPSTGSLPGFTRTLGADTLIDENPALPWRHRFVRLDAKVWTASADAGEQLHAAFDRACTALEMPFSAEPMPPYNLLLTRDWLLVVPRSQEKVDDISVNALGFAGSLFVRSKEQIEQLRAHGPLALLTAVAQQRP